MSPRSALVVMVALGCAPKAVSNPPVPPSPVTPRPGDAPAPSAEPSTSPKPDLGSEAKRPPPPAVDPAHYVTALEVVAAVHVEYAQRCRELADALEEVRSLHESTFSKADERVLGLADADLDLRGRMRAAMDDIMSVARGCATGRPTRQ